MGALSLWVAFGCAGGLLPMAAVVSLRLPLKGITLMAPGLVASRFPSFLIPNRFSSSKRTGSGRANR